METIGGCICASTILHATLHASCCHEVSSHALHEIALAGVVGLTSPIMHLGWCRARACSVELPSQPCIMTCVARPPLKRTPLTLTWPLATHLLRSTRVLLHERADIAASDKVYADGRKCLEAGWSICAGMTAVGATPWTHVMHRPSHRTPPTTSLVTWGCSLQTPACLIA
jgi:hypothetical protein